MTTVEVAIHNQDDREHDIFDSDDYFQFHGGMIATIRALSGKQPKGYFGDTQNPATPKVRDIKEEALRVYRTRVVNPKWLESISQHGYKGASEMAATVDYLFGFDATANVVSDFMYEQVAQEYALNETRQEFFESLGVTRNFGTVVGSGPKGSMGRTQSRDLGVLAANPSQSRRNVGRAG